MPLTSLFKKTKKTTPKDIAQPHKKPLINLDETKIYPENIIFNNLKSYIREREHDKLQATLNNSMIYLNYYNEDEGQTLLYVAVKEKNTKAAEILIGLGASKDITRAADKIHDFDAMLVFSTKEMQELFQDDKLTHDITLIGENHLSD